MGDPERARGMQDYFKHGIAAIGIAAPELRAFARERSRRLQQSWGASAAISLCDRLLQAREMEIRGAGILILAGFRKQLTPGLLVPAECWFEHRLDNWALVDGFCSAVLAPLLEQHPDIERSLHRWSRADSLWLRRASLVALVASARRGKRLDLVYKLAQQHFADPEDLMHKATGWLLREAGKTDPRRLKRFLRQHGPAIPRTTLRYAIERFSPAERLRLLRATRLPS